MHLTNDLGRRQGSQAAEHQAGRRIRVRLPSLFFRVWLLLIVTYFVSRVATRYAIAGYAGLDRHAWAEILLLPLFQAVFLLALWETFREWMILHRSARAIRRYPALGVVLLLDLILAPVLFRLQVHLLYVYLGLRCLFLGGFSLSLAFAGKLRRRSSDAEDVALPACVILIALPLALIQVLRLLGPDPIYYPWLWSTTSLILGLLLVNVIGIWSADVASSSGGVVSPQRTRRNGEDGNP